MAPKIIAEVIIWDGNNSLNNMSFPRTWVENYGISPTNIHQEGNPGDLAVFIGTLHSFTPGAIYTDIAIPDGNALYLHGRQDWADGQSRAYKENNSQTYNQNTLTIRPVGQPNKVCITYINDPNKDTSSLESFTTFNFDGNAPFACGN